MAAKMQRGLGRGLGALLGEAAENSEAARDEVRSLKLTDIDPNRGQPLSLIHISEPTRP